MTKKPDFMLQSLIANLFGNNSTSVNKAKKRKSGRTCRIEQLEEREMLSVNMLDFDLPAIEDAAVYQETTPFILAAEAEVLTELTGIWTFTSTNIGDYDLSQVTSIKNATITADGVELDFSSCTELSNTNLYAKNGGVIKFPVLTSATGKVGDSNNLYWDATGCGRNFPRRGLPSHSRSLTW